MFSRMLLSTALLAALAFAQSTPGPTVRFQTNLGNIDVVLLPGSAPRTVENFLKYVNRKAYDNSVFHRSVRNFIVQGGGFQANLPNLPAIPADPPVVNEYRESNLRGTIAMAKLGDNPNSATNQWFFNLGDNSGNLNNQNGGFTVFGRVADAASLAVMDRIAAVPVPSPGPLPAPFNEIPLQNFAGGTVQASNLIVVQSITQLTTVPAPAISEGGVQTAGAFGGFRTAAPGAYLEIYGSNLSEETRGWGDDFVNGVAPTSLAGVSVTVGGQRAFVTFVSPTQVNVQVPATVSFAPSLPVVLTFRGQTSQAVSIAVRPNWGGLLAPAQFLVGGRQFVYATDAVAPANVIIPAGVSGLTPNAARPNQVLTLYGLGFGGVSPFSIPIAGQIAPADGNRLTTLSNPVTVRIGGIDARVLFQGLAPGFVGLYQFNIVVPPDVTAGDLPLEVLQGGQAIAQTLLLPVQP
ncbi:MAG: peptidylprolyl isomerase [Bryobacter sp.]|nr:peptidylprolyl isomerase [Bryobacter sp. CoA8 C33]